MGNENPYGCSEKVSKVFYAAGKEVNRYAFASIPELKKSVANRFGLDKDQVLLGSGSSGLLEAIGHFMLHKKGEVTTAKPTFDILPAMLTKFQRKTHYVPLRTDHSLDLSGILDKTREHPGLVYIVNPNNPTGTAVPSQELRQFIEAARERYFRNINFLNEIHSNLADYFLGIWGGKSKPFVYSELQRQRFFLVNF